MFEAFQERDYRRFWAAQFASNVGSWMQTVAQSWLVYHLTDSPFLLGFVAFASSAPSIVLMLPGGVLADQHDRKRVVALSQMAQAASALGLALSIWFDTIAVWQIIVAALVVGVAQSFSAPAYQAMIVDLIEDRSRLANAVATNSLQFNLSRAVGPALAAVTLSAWGSFWCFLANALSFVPVILVLRSITNRQELMPQADMFARLREGFRFVRRDRLIQVLLGVVASASLFGYPYLNLMPILARRLFANDAAGNGWLVGAIGVGAFAGALVLSVRTPKRTLPIIIVATFVFGGGLMLTAVLTAPTAVIAALVVCGAAMVVGIALCNITIQKRVPDAMRGRVLSMYTFSFFAFIPFGNLLSGTLAEHRGIELTFLTNGAGVVLTGVVALVMLGNMRGRGIGE
ncbi:MAG: MFS transporter [Thermoanaerobaculia bacterium]